MKLWACSNAALCPNVLQMMKSAHTFRGIALPLLLVALSACCTQSMPPLPPELPATARQLRLPGVKNLHQVSPNLYRSAQPTPRGFSELRTQGIRSVLNLREYYNDTWRARHTDLHLMAYPMAAGDVQVRDVENCLRLIDSAPGPVLVHCWHGSDRTGIIVAAYRIVFQNWTVAQAEAEFRHDLYGYHDFLYSYLADLLRTTDWDAMRTRLLADRKSR